MNQLFKKTIWASDAIPAGEWKYRNLKRIMFPVIDVLLFTSGLFAVLYGIPAISEVFDRAIVNVFSTLLMISAFLAFMGVAFPYLWKTQVAAKSVILGLLTTYLGTLILLAFNGDPFRWFSIFIVLGTMSPIIWQISFLGAEFQVRNNTTGGE